MGHQREGCPLTVVAGQRIVAFLLRAMQIAQPALMGQQDRRRKDLLES